MRAICIDSLGTNDELVKDQVYDIISQQSTHGIITHYTVKGSTYIGSWMMERFRIVDANNDTQPIAKIKILKPLSKDCPCGINRKDCDYHKV